MPIVKKDEQLVIGNLVPFYYSILFHSIPQNGLGAPLMQFILTNLFGYLSRRNFHNGIRNEGLITYTLLASGLFAKN